MRRRTYRLVLARAWLAGSSFQMIGWRTGMTATWVEEQVRRVVRLYE